MTLTKMKHMDVTIINVESVGGIQLQLIMISNTPPRVSVAK